MPNKSAHLNVLTLVLRLVVEGKWLCPAFDAEYGSRVTGITLHHDKLLLHTHFLHEIRTQKILSFEITVTHDVQPETSSSYFGSVEFVSGCLDA